MIRISGKANVKQIIGSEERNSSIRARKTMRVTVTDPKRKVNHVIRDPSRNVKDLSKAV